MIPHSRPWITASDIAAVSERLHTGMIARGSLTRDLEEALAARYGFADAIVVGSGCQALLLALKAVGVGRGTRVALPTYVCPELLGVVDALDATAAICDVGEDYLLHGDSQDLAGIDAHAIVLPSLFGRRARSADLPASVPVIHDWAQYLPRAGSVPDVAVAVLSFGATKALAAGEGGAVLVQDGRLGETVRSFMALGGSSYGVNLFAFSDLQAALALSQLARLDTMIDRRLAIAGRLVAAAHDHAIDVTAAGADDVPFRLPMRLTAAAGPARSPDDVISALAGHGVAARRPVASLLHHVRPFAQTFPVAERLFDATFSLPLYPGLTDSELNSVILALDRVLHP